MWGVSKKSNQPTKKKLDKDSKLRAKVDLGETKPVQRINEGNTRSNKRSRNRDRDLSFTSKIDRDEIMEEASKSEVSFNPRRFNYVIDDYIDVNDKVSRSKVFYVKNLDEEDVDIVPLISLDTLVLGGNYSLDSLIDNALENIQRRSLSRNNNGNTSKFRDVDSEATQRNYSKRRRKKNLEIDIL